ncbi:MAG: DUF308 domain-containing protein [Thermoproteota archaeon]|nr:DUF308 domain-containing protein [Thermoproteota archaeon]
MSKVKSPGWVRAVQIGLGAIVIILSISMLVQPAIATVSIIVIAAVILLIVGIERVIYGIFIRHKSRLPTIGFGILVIILASIAIAFPVGTTIFLIYLIAFALLFDGISRIAHGVGDKESRGWSRGFSIGTGIVELVLSIMILVSPAIGAALVGIIIGIALLIVGIQIVVAGISGRRPNLIGKVDQAK